MAALFGPATQRPKRSGFVGCGALGFVMKARHVSELVLV